MYFEASQNCIHTVTDGGVTPSVGNKKDEERVAIDEIHEPDIARGPTVEVASHHFN